MQSIQVRNTNIPMIVGNNREPEPEPVPEPTPVPAKAFAFRSIGDWARDAKENPPSQERCAYWGIGELDSLLPLSPQQVIVVGGVPGAGKTSLVTQITPGKYAQSGLPGLLASLEVSGRRLGELWLKRHHSLALDDGRYLVVPPEEEVTIQSLELMIKQLKSQYEGFQFVVVDNYQLCEDHQSEGEYTRAMHIAKGMRRLANRYDLCIVGIAHLNKDGNKQLADGKDPGLHMFEGASTIGQSCTAAVILRKENDTETSLHVVKNNYGPLFSDRFRFDSKTQMYCGMNQRFVANHPSRLPEEDEDLF